MVSMKGLEYRIKIGLFVLFGILFTSSLVRSSENPPPLISFGGGHWDAGEYYSGGLFQLEYKFGNYLWRQLRPQATFIAPQLKSIFVGLGLGYELYFKKQFVFTPSFEPGYYYMGSGRNLGFPIEFRSCVEFAYEFESKVRIGIQAYHISNAHLSNRNPGGNSLTFFLALPFNALDY